MMNKDDERYESSVSGRRRGIEIIDSSDDRKESARISEIHQSIVPPAAAVSNQLLAVKRKRKSPEKPWKKPADMPKRPLSAYNLFFRDERERILGAGSEGKQQSEEAETAVVPAEGKQPSKKGKQKSGIGFSNLAKTIATKWNELDKEIRAPYEKIAAVEKKKYDELVAGWRVEQAAKKKALALAKKQAGEEQKTASRATANVYPSSDRSLGSFSDTSNPYPTEWFQSGREHDTSEREDTSSSRNSIPPIVETAQGTSYDSRLHGASMSVWQQGRHDPSASAYYQYPSSVYDPSMRYASDTERAAYTFPIDDSLGGSAPHDFSPVYRDFYHHSQQSMYSNQSSRRINDMRMSRAASLPAYRHGEMGTHHLDPSLRSPEELEHSIQQEMERDIANIHSSTGRPRQFRQQYSSSTGRGAMSYPRSSSMPYSQHQSPSSGNRRHRIHQVDYADQMGPPPPRYDDMHEESYRAMPPAYGHQQMMHGSAASHRHDPPTMEMDLANVQSINAASTASILQSEQGQPSASATMNESAIIQTSLQSLNETLDEDAISFITAMKYP